MDEQPLFYVLENRIEPATKSGGPPIHLLKVEILGLPSFVVVDRIGAIKLPRAAAGLPNSAAYSVVQEDRGIENEPEFEPLQPVTDVTLRPVCRPETAACSGWVLVAQVHMTKSRAWKSRDTRVTYEVNGRTYIQDLGEAIDATVPGDNYPNYAAIPG